MFQCSSGWLIVSVTCLMSLNHASAYGNESLDFNRDIRPILATHCWKCHGVDANVLGNHVRFDQEHLARTAAASGASPIVPGSPEASEIIRRLRSEDPDVRMPPPTSSQVSRPSAEEIRKLEQWIRDGARFEQHWSFTPPQKPALPEGFEQQNPVDAFVRNQLIPHGLTPAPEADRNTLLRRIALDMTGLPPDQELLRLRDASWEDIVDHVLASPHFGERMATEWLDAARYADTNGYFGDKPRQIWLWRDWVINAFNSNMPYDQFTTEQLAGDLLPSPTVSNRIATGFNRNHVANNETGIIDEEFRVEYVADRVNTTMATWMGLTAGCAQCHDHKYDPITQNAYYSLFAFFNNVPETGLITTDNPPPLIRVTTARQDAELSRLATIRSESESALNAIRPELEQQLETWLHSVAGVALVADSNHLLTHVSCEDSPPEDWHYRGTPVNLTRGIRGNGIRFDGTQHLESLLPGLNADQPWTIGFWFYPEGTLSCPVSKLASDEHRTGLEILWQKGRITVDLVHRWGISSIGLQSAPEVTANRWHHVVVAYDGGVTPESLQLYINGQSPPTSPRGTKLNGKISTNTPVLLGRREPGPGTYGILDEFRMYQRQFTSQEVSHWARFERVHGISERDRSSRTSDDQEFLFRDFVEHECHEETQSLLQAARDAKLAETEFASKLPVTLVMEEMPVPRVTHVLTRGQYDQHGAVVTPDVPLQFGEWPPAAPRNRLGLAQWIVSPRNPLTARVAVNRLWKICFGEGLVRTPGDFGVQGEFPTHPELLDWLAVTYRESSWDTKALLKIILSSQTYRQKSTTVSEPAHQIDPQNRLLWRAPTYRLSAEMIRDQALAVSGLLCRELGGPSVKPYQPDGLWEEVSYNGEDSYVADEGPGLYRRTLYTYIKRQSPPPSLLIFDGPTREKCTLHRASTNTPLQALVTLNDPTYIESARTLAARILEPPAGAAALPTPELQIQLAFNAVLCRTPSEVETNTLVNLLHQQLAHYTAESEGAELLLKTGAAPIRQETDPAKLAALTIVVHTLLNLDEAITRR